jgi:hypothetical protein
VIESPARAQRMVSAEIVVADTAIAATVTKSFFNIIILPIFVIYPLTLTNLRTFSRIKPSTALFNRSVLS